GFFGLGVRALGRRALAFGLRRALDRAKLLGAARLLLVDLLALPEPFDRLREPLAGILVIAELAERGPRLLGLLDTVGRLREVERIGDRLDLAEELRSLGALALD